MTNALRKAPQHTAVGFKQTVSGHGERSECSAPPQARGLCSPGARAGRLRALSGSAPGAQAADRSGAAARGDPGQAAVQAALPQALADALFPPDSGYDAPALLFQHRVPRFGGSGRPRGLLTPQWEPAVGCPVPV